MLYLAFDTETGGLPLRGGVPSDDPRQPHTAQIAAILFDQDGTEFEVMNRIVRQDGWTCDPKALEAHGITQGRSFREGIQEAQAYDEFVRLWERSNARVAHNVAFDDKIVRIGLTRFQGRTVADKWSGGLRHCTLEICTPILNLPPTPRMIATGFGGKPKSANLTECHQHFFGEAFDGAHDALADVRACKRVFLHLLRNGHVGEARAATLGDGPRRAPVSPPPPPPAVRSAARPAPSAIDTDGWL